MISPFGSAPAAPKDVEVASPPTDGISGLAWSPAADFLAASSWDNAARIWEVQPNGNTVPRCQIQHEAPALCVAWSKDGSKVVSGGCDKAARLMDMATGQVAQVAAHDAPIKCVRFFDTGNMQNCIVTAGWDKVIKVFTSGIHGSDARNEFWECRGTHSLPLIACAHLLITVTTIRSRVRSTGTVARQTQYPQCRFQSAHTPWIPSATCFVLLLLTVACKSSIWLSQLKS